MTMTLRDELSEVMCSNKIEDLEFLRVNRWQWILEKFAETFLSQGKLSLQRIWLWESVKKPYQYYQAEDTIKELEKILDTYEKYWFIVTDEDGKYWVLEGTGVAIIKVISESRYFEFYITDKMFSWFVCENHHNEIIIKINR